jgi:hypothetical protein
MRKQLKIMDAVFLFLMAASFAALSGMLGPWPLSWLR